MMPIPDKLIRQTIQSVNEAIHVIDTEFRIQYYNEALIDFCQKSGFPIDDPSNLLLFDLFPFLSNKIKEEYDLVFRTGETLVTEEESQVNDMEVITKTQKKPILDGGRVKYIVTLLEDVTDANLARQALSDSEAFNRAV
ncbi:MAG: PAS domain-containing protein, partial [FCB group bacterium]|nr:PAS domain-containing protein [FCB group bacterium]